MSLSPPAQNLYNKSLMSEEESAGPDSAPTDTSPAPAGQIPGAEKKLLCGILGIVLGGVGVHKFILGYNTEGIIMAGVTIGCSVLGSFLCFPLIGSMAMAIIGIVEGIIYLTKSDQEFVDTYINGKKTWF